MKLSLLILGFLYVGWPSLGHAQDEICFAQKNPDRGFDQEFQIQLKPAAVGGQILISLAGVQKSLGTISEMRTLDRTNPNDQPAFEAILGYVAPVDVSGLQPTDLNTVSTITGYRAPLAGGDEVLVYRLYAGSKQIGGSFIASGMGTSCLPR